MSTVPEQATLTKEMIEDARKLIGVWLRRQQHNAEVHWSNISRWDRAIGDRNPLFLDEGYANRSAVGSLTAPPCWLYTVDDTVVAPKFPGLHAIYGGTDWEFYRRIFVGERITVKARLTGVEEKKGHFCGDMVLEKGEVIYSNQRGEMIARARPTVVRTQRGAAVKRAKYLGWSKYKYAHEELIKVEDTYDAEIVRGKEHRYWEDVAAGAELQPVVKGPLTSEDMLQFVCSTTPIRGFTEFLNYRRRHPAVTFLNQTDGAWDMWEGSLAEDRVARMFGFPFAHDTGIDRISWVGNLLTNWMGDSGFLKQLNVKLLLPDIYGDATWCKGKVTGKRTEGNEHLVDCDVWCENERGWITAQGKASIALPSKSLD